MCEVTGAVSDEVLKNAELRCVMDAQEVDATDVDSYGLVAIVCHSHVPGDTNNATEGVVRSEDCLSLAFFGRWVLAGVHEEVFESCGGRVCGIRRLGDALCGFALHVSRVQRWMEDAVSGRRVQTLYCEQYRRRVCGRHPAIRAMYQSTARCSTVDVQQNLSR